MVTIIFPLIICYIGTFFISRIYVKGIFNHKQSKYFLLALLGVIFITVINFREKYQDLGFPIRETWLFNEYNYPFIGEYLNIFRTYSERGILFFLVIPGIFYLFSKQNKNYLEIAFILIIFFQIFWILDAEYFFPIVSITLSVIIGYGFQSLKNIIKSKNQALAFCIAFIFIIPISFSIFQRDIATRVQIERDWPVWYDGTEHDDTSLWRSAYIDEEDMILSDSTEVHKLGDNGKIMLLEDNIIIWKWRNVSDSLVVEPLTITDVLFHQPGLHYGGKVTDWTTGERDIFGEKHEGYILRMVEVRPSYKNLIEYYELKWIISLNRSDWAEDYEFVESSKETSYSIYSNELFTVLYYKSW